MEGPVQTLDSGERSWHQKRHFIVQPCFYTQNTQFFMFYPTVVVGAIVGRTLIYGNSTLHLSNYHIKILNRNLK